MAQSNLQDQLSSSRITTPRMFNPACQWAMKQCQLGHYAPVSRQAGPCLVPWEDLKEWLDTGPSSPSGTEYSARYWEGKIYGRGEQTTSSLLRLLHRETDSIDLIFLSCPSLPVGQHHQADRAWRYILRSLLSQLRAYYPRTPLPQNLSQQPSGVFVATIRSWLMNSLQHPRKKVLVVLDRFHSFMRPAPHPSGDNYKHLDQICVLLHRALQAHVLWITSRVDDYLTINKQTIGGDIIEAEQVRQRGMKRGCEEETNGLAVERPSKRVKSLLKGGALLVDLPGRPTEESLERARQKADADYAYMLRTYTHFHRGLCD